MKVSLAAFALALAFPAPANAASPESAVTKDSASDARSSRAIAGVIGPRAGELSLGGAVGMVFMIPHLTASARVGVGAGFSGELRYRNLGFLGQAGRVRALWGTRAAADLELGGAAWTSIMTLAPADGSLIGIQFSSIALGNDWEAGAEAALTWIRPKSAHVTVEAGPRFVLGGVRYPAFDTSEFVVEPGMRGIDFAVLGEWRVAPRLSALVRLDGLVLTSADTKPYGFLPTGSVGFGWLI